MLNSENSWHKTSRKVGTLEWKDYPCSRISRISIVKVTILPKAIYRLKSIPIKILTQFFTDLGWTIFNIIWKNKQTKNSIAKTVLYDKRTSEGIIIPDFKLYYRVIVIKPAWYWHKNWLVGRWNWIEDADINSLMSTWLFF